MEGIALCDWFGFYSLCAVSEIFMITTTRLKRPSQRLSLLCTSVWSRKLHIFHYLSLPDHLQFLVCSAFRTPLFFILFKMSNCSFTEADTNYSCHLNFISAQTTVKEAKLGHTVVFDSTCLNSSSLLPFQTFLSHHRQIMLCSQAQYEPIIHIVLPSLFSNIGISHAHTLLSVLEFKKQEQNEKITKTTPKLPSQKTTTCKPLFLSLMSSFPFFWRPQLSGRMVQSKPLGLGIRLPNSNLHHVRINARCYIYIIYI